MATHKKVKANPPIPGHELKFEGRVFKTYYANGGVNYGGGCFCGAVPEDFPDVSANAMKRWHRQHKEEIRTKGDPS